MADNLKEVKEYLKERRSYANWFDEWFEGMYSTPELEAARMAVAASEAFRYSQKADEPNVVGFQAKVTNSQNFIDTGVVETEGASIEVDYQMLAALRGLEDMLIEDSESCGQERQDPDLRELLEADKVDMEYAQQDTPSSRVVEELNIPDFSKDAGADFLQNENA